LNSHKLFTSAALLGKNIGGNEQPLSIRLETQVKKNKIASIIISVQDFADYLIKT